DHFRVVQAIIEGHRAARIKLAAWRSSRAEIRPMTVQTQSGGSPAARAEELGTDNLIYREPQDETWKSAWEMTEKLIDTMRDEVLAHHARFFVATLSNGIQVAPSAQVRTDFLKRVGATDLFYPDHRIRNLGSRDGF